MASPSSTSLVTRVVRQRPQIDVSITWICAWVHLSPCPGAERECPSPAASAVRWRGWAPYCSSLINDKDRLAPGLPANPNLISQDTPPTSQSSPQLAWHATVPPIDEAF